MAKIALILLLVILIGLPGLGLSRSFAETSNDYVLSNDRLILELHESTGLCQVTDKQTGRIWSQCYAIPPENGKAYSFDFTDSGTWSLNGAKVTDSDLWIPANANSQIQVKMNFPAQTLLPASYVLRFAYRLEQASDIKFDGCFYFEQDGYTPKGNKPFLIVASPAGDVQTHTEWQYAEIPINIEDFPAYANCFLVYFTVTGGEKATGAVVIHDAALYGGSAASAIPKVSNVCKTGSALTFSVNNLERELAQLPPIHVSVSLTPSRSDEVSFTLSAEEDDLYYQTFSFPGSFVTQDESLYWVLPKDAGLYLPAYDLNNATNNAYHGGEIYAHMGLNMSMYGAVCDREGDGYFAIMDTPALTAFSYMRCGTDGKTAYVPQLLQIGTNNYWAADRTVRYRFFESGGYVGMANAYRQIAEEKGYAVTLREKAEKNPNILRSAGASRLDLAIEMSTLDLFLSKLKEAGVTNVMVKLGSMRNNIAYIQWEDLLDQGIYDLMKEKYSEYYLYEYACYRDMFDRDGEFKADPEYVKLASPYKLRSINGNPVLGWVDITGLQSYVICPSFGEKYLEYHFNRYPLSSYPVYARMYDVVATASLNEGVCYDEDHPGTRMTCMEERLEFMRISAEVYGMDNHTEGAAEYLIPYVNSGEGPLDIMSNNGTSGLNSMGVSPADRIPFWELVYHDCFGIYYHWEHGIEKQNPHMAEENLYCLLYGERGMFMPVYNDMLFTVSGGTIERFIHQMKRIDAVTTRIALEKMINHEFLTKDRLVQRTTFSDGTQIVVNFAEVPYTYQDGTVIDQKSELVLPAAQ